MKRIAGCLFVFLLMGAVHAQVDFKWDKIDSVGKSKDQIYSDTKLFIAEKWNSAQSVIQNDDKENGSILVKGSSSKTTVYMLNEHYFVFSYTVKFFMKEGKYRVQIDNVTNTSHICGTHTWSPVNPVDNFQGNQNLSQKRGIEIFSKLKKELQSIVDNYDIYIKNPSTVSKEW